MAAVAQQPSMGWLEGREHVLPVRIYYEDTDFTGVVYHANYLRYFERGRSDFLRLAGVDHRMLLERPDPAAFAVTKIAVAYKRAARVDDALLVRTTYDAVKGPRLIISQRIFREGDLIATADVEAACIALDGRPRRPPPGLVEALAPLFA
jgi:acyl-CoA thioester hydrolase